MSNLISIADAAKMAGVHVQTVRRWVSAGRVQAYNLAGANKFWVEKSDIEKMLVPIPVTGPSMSKRPAKRKAAK